MRRLVIPAVLLLPLTLVACAGSGFPAASPPVTGGVVVQSGPRGTQAGVRISVGDARRMAVEYGLTGYRSLPPGIARNLARGKPLPPGIARRGVPSAMNARLPVIDGHEWRVAGDDLILVVLGTLVVADVLADVFR